MPKEGTGRRVAAQSGFNTVEMADLKKDEAGLLRGVFPGFEKLAADMGPAGREPVDRVPLLVMVLVLTGAEVGGISPITIALHGAVKAGRDDVIQARGRAAGGPMEKGFALRMFAGP